MSENLVFISWENEKSQIPVSFINNSEFIKNLPDYSQEIKLSNLEIDSVTLKFIEKYFSSKDKSFDSAKSTIPGTPVLTTDLNSYSFFNDINEEQLLLLIIAADKLDLEDLQKQCSAQIAMIFRSLSKEEINSFQTIEEQTIDEEDYLKYNPFKFNI